MFKVKHKLTPTYTQNMFEENGRSTPPPRIDIGIAEKTNLLGVVLNSKLNLMIMYRAFAAE